MPEEVEDSTIQGTIRVMYCLNSTAAVHTLPALIDDICIRIEEHKVHGTALLLFQNTADDSSLLTRTAGRSRSMRLQF